MVKSLADKSLVTVRYFIDRITNSLRSKTGKYALLIFGVALISRGIIAAFQIINGIHPISFFPMVQTWTDFYSIYGQELVLLNRGLLSYNGFFTYTPLFLYALLVFYRLGGIAFASAPILLADAATASFVYLNTSRISNHRVAVAAGLCYSLSPFMLIFEGYLWLSNQPMFLLMILAIYLLRNDKPLFASLMFGIAVMFKQEAVFVLPAFVVWYLWKCNKNAWKGFLVFLMTMVAISLPFFLTSPINYLNNISYGVLLKFLPVVTTASPSNIASTGKLAADSVMKSGVCSLINSTGIQTLSSCVFGYVTYSSGQPGAIWLYGITGGIMTIVQWASQFVVIPIFALVGFILFLSRKRSNLLELVAAYSTIGSLVVFSLLVHGLLTYYFLPVYGLLFAASKDLKTVTIVALCTLVSLFVTDGPFQAALPLLAISAILPIGYSHPQIPILKTHYSSEQTMP
jgi:hypothetical protein